MNAKYLHSKSTPSSIYSSNCMDIHACMSLGCQAAAKRAENCAKDVNKKEKRKKAAHFPGRF